MILGARWASRSSHHHHIPRKYFIFTASRLLNSLNLHIQPQVLTTTNYTQTILLSFEKVLPPISNTHPKPNTSPLEVFAGMAYENAMHFGSTPLMRTRSFTTSSAQTRTHSHVSQNRNFINHDHTNRKSTQRISVFPYPDAEITANLNFCSTALVFGCKKICWHHLSPPLADLDQNTQQVTS